MHWYNALDPYIKKNSDNFMYATAHTHSGAEAVDLDDYTQMAYTMQLPEPAAR